MDITFSLWFDFDLNQNLSTILVINDFGSQIKLLPQLFTTFW